MREKRLPAITHLQFLVLGAILNSPQPGRTIRQTIAGYGIRRSGPAFYQMMARLERDGLVEGWYEAITVGDQSVKERRYRIQPKGARLWTATRAFYEEAGAATARERWSNA